MNIHHPRRHLVQKELALLVVLPALVGLLQLGMAMLEIARTDAAPPSPVWLLVALAVGFGFGHAMRVAWDVDALQVILVGGQVLLTLAFLAISLGSRVVLMHALDLGSAGVLALLVAGGLLLGHSLGLLGEIRRALTS
jgi:hypothetical protein